MDPMNRRAFLLLPPLTVAALTVLPRVALAAPAGSAEQVAGLREALLRGTAAAVDSLGRPDGFLGNPRVRIPLPATLARAESTLRRFGMGAQADALVETMNRAAESAVVEAKPLFVSAVRKMTVADVQSIVRGPDDAATQYFRRTTGEALTARFLPIVQAATARTQVTQQYQKLAGRAARFGLLDAREADLDRYVTERTLDGLFTLVADEERAIRRDPVATGSALLKKVFGDLLR